MPSTTARRYHFAIAALGLALLSPRGAAAQVHWDVGIQAGVTERWTSGGAAMPSPTPGPGGEIHAHVAVLPMLRVGPYAAFDLSPAPRTNARQVYAAGLRAKLTPPWLAAPWHAWAFFGVGFADAYTPGYRPAADVGARSTGMLELPIGVGIACKANKGKGPWELYAELAARITLARGSIGGMPSGGGAGAPVTPFVGDDLLAVSLSVGVSLAQ